MSLVQYCGVNKDPHPCGYCKSRGSESLGMYTWQLTPEDYQTLMDRVWRRCGRYCYKMVMEKTCCPPYTIRCEALRFKPSRSQRQVLKRMHNFVVFGQDPKKESYGNQSNGKDDDSVEVVGSSKERDSFLPDKRDSPLNGQCNSTDKDSLKRGKNSTKKIKRSTHLSSQIGSKAKTLVELYPRPAKARFKRMKRKLEKIMKNSDCSEEDAIEIMLNQRREKLAKQEKPFENYFEYSSPKPAHNIEITFILVSFAKNYPGFQESYELYKKYQVSIHKDDPSELTPKSFENFLIINPYVNQKPFSDESKKLPYQFGTYHMHYRLDGKLFAVGVLDVLPECISSVYFYYDTDYDFLSLGTYSALREIQLLRQMNAIKPSIKYYYMGFYIHNCQKMRYKGKYHPSYLLCYQSMNWQPIEKCLPKFEESPFPRLDPDPDAMDQESLNITDGDIQILYDDKSSEPAEVCDYQTYKRVTHKEENQEVYSYAKSVGKTLARRMYLYRSLDDE